MPTVALTLARFTPADRDDWLAAAAALLSAQERERVEAMPAADVRTQHAIGRALLRLAGAGAGQRDPAGVAIAIAEDGKPELAEMPELGVSVAHSGRMVVVAACQGAAVGVDIEAPRPDVARSRKIAERRFAASEAAALRALPDALVADWFVRAWTIKEAVGKAVGTGVIPALAGAVVAGPTDDLALVGVWTDPPADSWSLHQLAAPDGDERIAVAVPRPGVTIGAVTQLTLEDFNRSTAPRASA
jgi:4'-phosphopantetheinyl transferase